MKRLIFLFFLASVALSTSLAQHITNVVAVQKDSLVEITYNLGGDDPANISVYYREKDGEEFKGPLLKVYGDVGDNIIPGTKKIIWNVLMEQDFLVGNNIIFRLQGLTKFSSFVDERDGKNYKTVKIGDQIWMAENLDYDSKYNAYPYDRIKSNGAKYGFLYKWKAAIEICPSGWHLPSKSDFETLIFTTKSVTSLLIGGGSGFSVLFGGYIADYGTVGINNKTGFWTSSKEDKNDAWHLLINASKVNIYTVPSAGYWFYVRCIKD